MKKEPSFSIFKNAMARSHMRSITLSQAIEKIHNGEWREQVIATREVLTSQSSAAYKKQRTRTLPLFALSGDMPRKAAGETLKRHSGLLQGDFDGKDHPNMATDEMREIVISSPYVVAAFVSPSGSGIKAIIRIQDRIESHRSCFRAAEQHFAELGLKIDPSTKDEKRLCFVSYDPDLWSRNWEDTQVLPPDDGELNKPENQLKDHSLSLDFSEKSKSRNTSILKHSRSQCTIDDIEGIELQITQKKRKERKKSESERPNIADLEVAAERAKARLSKDKHLLSHYQQFIEKVFTPRQGERNSQLVAMVTFLFRAISESSVMPLAMFYYDLNQDVFSDNREQHEQEAKSQLCNTKRTWLKSLNEIERSRYDEFAGERQRYRENAFRVCRELGKESEKTGKNGVFFLSGKQLGTRINHNPTEGGRILNQFVTWEILDLVKKGTQYRKNQEGEKGDLKAGMATSYSWRLI